MRVEYGQTVSVAIASGSMAPLIAVGEVVEVASKINYEPFDVVVYHHVDGRLICHYIWQKSQLDPRGYLIRSLKGAGFDLPVSAEQILGHVSGKRLAGRWKVLIFFRLLGQRLSRGIL